MEIGALALLVIISLAVCWSEGTKTGRKFTEWALKTFTDININDLED